LQDRLSFAELADYYGVGGGPSVVADKPGKPFEYILFRPAQDYDPTEHRVYHLPMAMHADQSMAMRGMRLFGADPTRPLMLVGNPAAAGVSTGRLSPEAARTVWGGDLAPTVAPLVKHLREIGVESVDHLGFSYGADKAVVAASQGVLEGLKTSHAVLMEPASTVDRGLVRLLRDFIPAGGKHLQSAVEASESEPYLEARKLADTGLTRYGLGLLRLSNIAIANALAHDYFESRTESALVCNPDMFASLAWGTASELTPNANMERIGRELAERNNLRVGTMALSGMHHAGGDDIDLHAAIVLQAYHQAALR
jgi:hypothetical protein